MKILKYILTIIALLSVPSITFAAIPASWSTGSTTATIIPYPFSGLYPAVLVPNIVGTSTTATSSFPILSSTLFYLPSLANTQGGTINNVPFIDNNGLFNANTNGNFVWDNVNTALNIGGANSINGFLNVYSGTTTASAPYIQSDICNVNTFCQIFVQNLSNGTTSSIGVVFGDDQATASSTNHYGEIGYNSSTNIDSSFPTFAPSDLYIYNTQNGIDLATATSAPITFSTGGVLSGNRRMIILSNGNVGIGSSTPSQILTIATSGPVSQIYVDDRFSVGQSSLFLGANGLTGANQGSQITQSSQLGDTYFNSVYTGGTNAFHFQVGSYPSATELLTMKTNGYVGIGTTSPSSLLTVQASTSIGQFSPVFVVASSTASPPYIYTTNQGNTSIGTTTLSGKFNVDGTTLLAGFTQIQQPTPAQPPFYIRDVNNNVILRIDIDGTILLRPNSSTDTVKISPSTTTASYFNAGKVGIATTSPNSSLDVGGFISTGTNYGYRQDSNLILYASSSAADIFVGQGAGAASLVSGNTSLAGNTTLGYQSFNLATTTVNDTAIGYQALKNDVGAGANTAVGWLSCPAITTSTQNVCIGSITGNAITTGGQNTLVGYAAGASGVTMNSVVAVGLSAGRAFTGANSIFLGTNAGFGDKPYYSVLGNQNTYLGQNTGQSVASTTALNYASAIGYGATVGCSNCMVLGATTTTAYENVGIGTSTPSAALTISPPSSTVIPFIISSSTASAASSTLFTVLNSGFVGIGTTTPQYGLDVETSSLFGSNIPIQAYFGNGILSGAGAQGAIKIGDSVISKSYGSNWILSSFQPDGDNTRQMGATNARYATIYTYGLDSATTSLALKTNGITRMTLDTAGNVGIGTTSPIDILSVVGNIVTAGANSGISLLDRTNGTRWQNYTNAGTYKIWNGTQDIFYLTSGGNVGIGSSTPSTALVVVGTTTTTGVNITKGVSYAGQAVCYMADGSLGHQTSAQLTALTCVAN